MHTQNDTAQAILGRGADYVITVKANMHAVRQLKKLPWTRIRRLGVSTKGGGKGGGGRGGEVGGKRRRKKSEC